MRSFLAVSLPNNIKEGIYGELSFLDTGGVKRTSKENLHITAAFMGDSLSADDKAFFSEIMEEISFPSFYVSLGRTGAFPSREKPSVLWVGLEKGEEEMNNLRKKIYSAVRKAGFSIEEKFHPHITVARLKENFSRSFLPDFFEKDFSGRYSFKAEALVWYESVLSQKGPEYKEIFRKEFL